jgi:repressor LexA
MAEPADLTARQKRILEFIADTVRERGYPPTVREIGEAVGLTSSSSVHSQLENLAKMGLLFKDPTKPRAIGLADERVKPEAVVVPVIGRIAAGAPVLAAENVEDYVTVPLSHARGGEHFALRVTGQSMSGAGILDGDVVVVRHQGTAPDGEIVVALLPGIAEDEATVKRLRRRDGRVTLVPENPVFSPIEMSEGGQILGKVVAVLRKL